MLQITFPLLPWSAIGFQGASQARAVHRKDVVITVSRIALVMSEHCPIISLEGR